MYSMILSRSLVDGYQRYKECGTRYNYGASVEPFSDVVINMLILWRYLTYKIRYDGDDELESYR
jgi:hypothetical protein